MKILIIFKQVCFFQKKNLLKTKQTLHLYLTVQNLIMFYTCADLERYIRGVSNFDKFFLLFIFSVDEGREDQKITITGSASVPAKRHLNGA